MLIKKISALGLCTSLVWAGVDLSDPPVESGSRRDEHLHKEMQFKPQIGIEEHSNTSSSEEELNRRTKRTHESVLSKISPLPEHVEESPIIAVNTPQSIDLTLPGLIREVLRRNAIVNNDRLQLQITQRQEDYEGHLFEPLFTAKYNVGRVDSPTAAEDALSKGGSASYTEQNHDLSVSLSGLTLSGGDWNLAIAHNDKSGTVVDNFKTYDTEYDAQVKLSLRQPLLKGLGGKITKANYNKAVLDRKIYEGQHEKLLMELVERSIKEYWKLYGAQELQKSLEQSVKLAKENVQLLKDKQKGGEASDYEMLEAEGGLITRELELSSMESSVEKSQNSILDLLNVSEQTRNDLKLIPLGKESLNPQINTLDEYLAMANDNMPDIQIAQNKLQRARIEHLQRSDDLRPKLDITASGWLNHLNSSPLYSDLQKTDHKSWEVAVEFSLPIAGGGRERSALAVANLKAEQAYRDVSGVARSLKVNLNTKLDQLKTSSQQKKTLERAFDIKNKILAMELKKLKFGESSVKEVFEKEESMIDFQRQLLNKTIEEKYAEVSLSKMTGSLIENYVDLATIIPIEDDGEPLHKDSFKP